jgi:hypothetical protein
MHELVELLEECDGIEVFAAAERVRHPLTLLARVVEVEHRRDRINAQPVDVELAQPEERICEQEVLHLGATEVEHVRAPVGMLTAPWVVVLVERRAVEARERPRIGGEVRGHPVEDHADPVRVHVVDEVTEVVRRPHRRQGRVEPGDLVPPRARVGVVHHRQELDVREAEVADVRRQLIGELPPAQAASVGRAAPGRRVQLVGRQRPLQLLLRMARLDPVRVLPLVFRLEDHGCGLRRDLRLERNGVGLFASVEVVLVVLTDSRALDDAFPDPGGVDRFQLVRGGVPVVEVADHAHVLRVRRPHRKAHAAVDAMRAELRVELLVPPRAREPDVELAERRRARLCAAGAAGGDSPLLRWPRGAQTGTSSSSMRTIPATGIFTHSGRLLSS